MDTYEFLVQGSAADPYRITVRRRDGGKISAYCTCPAGENGMFCKHRVRILRGLSEGVVSQNQADVKIVAGWLAGTDVERALRTVDELEQEAEKIKKAISSAKKVLSRSLLE
jgi:uncharacterized Zn finger protein